MDELARSYWPKSLSRALGLVVFVAIFLIPGPSSARGGAAPQQAGAVPLSQGIADLASKLAKGIPQGQTMTIAVTDFPDLGGQTCQLGRYVAERISTLLSQHPQCRLIERRRLDMVLQELKFSMSELVDPGKARKLGQMLGVQGLVVGAISDLGSTLDVDARIIDIQTDLSLPGASASIVKDEAVTRMSSDCSGVGGGATLPARQAGPTEQLGPRRGPAPPTGVSVQRVAKNGFTFELTRCRKRDITEWGRMRVDCEFVITSEGEDRDLRFGGHARAFDDAGYSDDSREAELGNKSDDPAVRGHRNTLLAGEPTNAGLMFHVSPEARIITFLDMDCEADGRAFKVQFRNIPLGK